jgi:hypothetical protein
MPIQSFHQAKASIEQLQELQGEVDAAIGRLVDYQSEWRMRELKDFLTSDLTANEKQVLEELMNDTYPSAKSCINHLTESYL